MAQISVSYEDLPGSDLHVDGIYEGGPQDNFGGDVLSKLLPVCQNMGGFRWAVRRDDQGKARKLPAYLVLFTTMDKIEWPDYLDVESGVFRYYGDNRAAGRSLLQTKGNRFLNLVFEMLNSKDWTNIPPILVFQKAGHRRDVRFLGLAAPGNPKLSSDRDLVSFWRTVKGKRFQNYEAYFTILDTRGESISNKWLRALIDDHANSLKLAPGAWREFVAKGRDGIRALTAEPLLRIPSREEQLGGFSSLPSLSLAIHTFYRHRGNFTGFEACAADIVNKIDPNFEHFELTRPWRDGGRDALGYYRIGTRFEHHIPLKIDCALEAKCYLNQAVGVHEMSRLISRIRYRQFGVMVTTSWVNKQAYKEVIVDRHPIVILTGADINGTLLKFGLTPADIPSYLESVESRFVRLT